jgi:hypothetical protein
MMTERLPFASGTSIRVYRAPGDVNPGLGAKPRARKQASIDDTFDGFGDAADVGTFLVEDPDRPHPTQASPSTIAPIASGWCE